MWRAACVVVLVAVSLGSAQSWDIAVTLKDHLVFITNGTKSNTVNLIGQNPTSLVYDEVHNMMLYVDKQSNDDTICGYSLSSKDNKCFIKRNGRNIHSIAFDPVTEKIFFTDTNERSINFFSLKSEYNNNVYGNLLIKMDYWKNNPTEITLDYCRGYIYWNNPITKHNDDHWERAQLNGSKREVILTRTYYETYRMAIDIKTQKIYYFDYCQSCKDGYLNSANLSGYSEALLRANNKFRMLSKVLTVSKDYIYFVNSSESFDTVWQLRKNARMDVEPKEISKFNERILGITANYKIADQINGIQDCDLLSNLMSEHTGERCDVSACENYCLQGNCSFNDEGRPECSCNAGYTGDRCEVDTCYGYCLNTGECTLNEEDEPVCQCVGNHEGLRCEADINDSIATYDSVKRNLTLAYLMSILRKPSPKIYLTVEV